MPTSLPPVFESDAELFFAKLLPVLVYPLGLAIALILIGGLCACLRLWRWTASSIGAALILLWVCSAPVFAGWALASLERQYPPRAIADTPEADVAIVLGGAIGQPVPPRVELDLSAASDRVLHASRLYRAGKVKRILVTAGNFPWLPAAKPEAELIKELLVEWGVPAAVIEIAGASRNTYENALEIKDIWRRSPFTSALLVTSAAHMPRAIAVFRRAGLPVVASTTDVEVVDASALNLFAWLPDAAALATTTAAAKEWIGYWAYRARGYL
jgi:uncharacterized SAM-binding protein YcdF (DUF218 family)